MRLTNAVFPRTLREGNIHDVIVHITRLVFVQGAKAARRVLLRGCQRPMARRHGSREGEATTRTLPTSIGPQNRLERTTWKGLHPPSQRCVNSLRLKLSFVFSARCSCSSASRRELSATTGPSSSPVTCLSSISLDGTVLFGSRGTPAGESRMSLCTRCGYRSA